MIYISGATHTETLYAFLEENFKNKNLETTFEKNEQNLILRYKNSILTIPNYLEFNFKNKEHKKRFIYLAPLMLRLYMLF
jgi:hypothetical protein